MEQKRLSKKWPGSNRSAIRNDKPASILNKKVDASPLMFWVPLNISGRLFRCLAESRPSGRNGREREREREKAH